MIQLIFDGTNIANTVVVPFLAAAATVVVAPIVCVCVCARVEAPWDQLNYESWQI